MSRLTILTRLLTLTFLLIMRLTHRAEAQSLFVANGSGYGSRIGVYTTSGATVNASLVNGLNSARGASTSSEERHNTVKRLHRMRVRKRSDHLASNLIRASIAMRRCSAVPAIGSSVAKGLSTTA
jgi:hypothetical protein